MIFADFSFGYVLLIVKSGNSEFVGVPRAAKKGKGAGRRCLLGEESF
jgi:hypothetical protein